MKGGTGMKRASKWLWMGLAIAGVLACFVPFASSLLGPLRGIVGLLAVLLLLFVVRSFAVGKEKDNCSPAWRRTAG